MVLPVRLLNIVYLATIAVWSRSVYGQNCHRYNVSRIPVVEPSSISDMYYFSCADGEFLTSVDVWYGNSADGLRWICSDGDASHYPDDTFDYNYSWVAFDVGISAVETSFISDYYDDSSDSYVFLGDSYIGGYNLAMSTSTSDGVIFEWNGPFGTGDNYTTDTWTSNCPSNSYATGATWWISPGSRSLNGIQLECADVTSTCYPPNHPNQGDDDSGSSSTTDYSTGSYDDHTGQDCDRFNVSRIPIIEPGSYPMVYYFSCGDEAFFTSVDVWHGNSVGELRWRCSNGDASYYPDDTSDYNNYGWVTFDVGITAVEASFISSLYDDSSDTEVFLGDSYIGGYNLAPSTSTSDGLIFEWSGPFGTGDTYTIDTWTSSCPPDSYAAGATWWIYPFSGSLNGIQLECANVTSTCYPPGLSNQGDDDLSSSTTTDGYTTSTGPDDDPITTGDDDSIITLIAVAVSATAAVVAVAVGVCMCCFFRSRHRVMEQAPSLPVRINPPDPCAPGRPPAYQEAPPAYESPRASARTDPPSKIYNGQ